MSSRKQSELFRLMSQPVMEIFRDEGIDIKHPHCLHVLSNALSYWAYDLIVRDDVPATRIDLDLDVKEMFRAYASNAMIEAIVKYSEVSELRATALAGRIAAALFSEGFCLDGRALLFNPDLRSVRKKVIKAITAGRVASKVSEPPVQASVAVMLGFMPDPPEFALTKQVGLLGRERYVSKDLESLFAEQPERAFRVFVIPPDVGVDRLPRPVRPKDLVDHHDGAVVRHAEISFSFVVIAEKWQGSSRPGPRKLEVYNAVYRFRAGRKSLTDPEFTRGEWQIDLMRGQGYALLENDVLPAGIAFDNLPRLELCPKCLSFHVPELPEWEHPCTELDVPVKLVKKLADSLRIADNITSVSKDQFMTQLVKLVEENGGTPPAPEMLANWRDFIRQNALFFRMQEGRGFASGEEVTTWLLMARRFMKKAA